MFARVMAGAVSVTAAAVAAAGLLLAPASQAAASGNVQLTGTELASALLPASYFPSGYKVIKDGDYNSGGRLEQGPARYHLATFSCQTYVLHGLPQTGMGETATADVAVLHQGLRFYQQTAWQFSSSSRAAAFYQQMYAFTARCRTITATGPGYTWGLTTQSLTRTHLGDRPAFQAVQTQTETGRPATVNDTLVTVAGTDVFLIDAFGSPKPPTKPTPATVVLHLIGRVQAAG